MKRAVRNAPLCAGLATPFCSHLFLPWRAKAPSAQLVPSAVLGITTPWTKCPGWCPYNSFFIRHLVTLAPPCCVLSLTYRLRDGAR